MQTEPDELPTVAWRAAGHAALSDPGRLLVVDAVTAGERTPTDLARALGMSSNLLAHHLRVLESAGLIRRTPSESDGRRSYVGLVPGALDALARRPVAPPPTHRVVFVCSGNSARSQLAAAVWADRVHGPVTCAGTRPAAQIHPGTVRVARRHGLTLVADRPQSTGEVLAEDDVIVTVCDSADREVRSAHLHWSIPDPVPLGSDRAFEATLLQVTGRIEAWLASSRA